MLENDKVLGKRKGQPDKKKKEERNYGEWVHAPHRETRLALLEIYNSGKKGKSEKIVKRQTIWSTSYMLLLS